MKYKPNRVFSVVPSSFELSMQRGWVEIASVTPAATRDSFFYGGGGEELIWGMERVPYFFNQVERLVQHCLA